MHNWLESGGADRGPDLARCCAEAIQGAPHLGRECLRREDEGGAVGPEVAKEVREAVDEEEQARVILQTIKVEAQDSVDDRHEDKTLELDGFAADAIHQPHRHVITGQAYQRQNCKLPAQVVPQRVADGRG